MRIVARISVLLAILSLSPVCRAATAPSELPMTVSYEFDPEPVNTDRIGELDPEMQNPHRQHWVLNRKVELKGLEVRNLPHRRFGVETRGIESTSRGYIRGEGPWYQSLDDLPCQKEPEPLFATAQGTRVAVNEAGAAWKALLKNEMFKLALMLKKVSEPTREAALKRGLQDYQKWLRQLESAWAARGLSDARSAEWAYYRQEARKAGICTQEKRTHVPTSGSSSFWIPMMEPVAPISPTEGWVKPLARAPARRWNGAFSVRLDIQLGSRTLSGQFLVDSGSNRSLISPAWLKGQGYLPALVELPGAPLERVVLDGESGMAPLALVDRVALSNFPIDLHEFLIFDTDIYLPPEHASSCCDGILGVDFLEKYVVEFVPARFNEVAIWPRKGFQPLGRLESERARTGLELADPLWAEAHVTASGKVVSDGAVLMRDGKKTDAGISLPKQMVWDTGNEEGMDFLGRGPFIMDLPHGRIWFSKPALETPIRNNQTGLSLGYFRRDGDRVLKVTQIRPGSGASDLLKEGLKVGTEILQVDSMPVETMDLWEVEQHLAGVYGDAVTLQWWVRKGMVKMASLKARKS